MNNFNYDEFEKDIKYKFKNRDLLITALTHTSYANEMKINKRECYERSEFLGDAILEYIVSDYLIKNYPDYSEGKLTKLRASLVCEYTLSQVAKKLNYGTYVVLSKGEELTGGRNRDSIMCDLFESVLGAIYLDGGLEPAITYVETHLLHDIEDKSLFYDAKSTLQEYVQKNGQSFRYELVSESGPDHNKFYKSRVIINNIPMAEGTGHSIKNAEQSAAYNTLIIMKEQGSSI